MRKLVRLSSVLFLLAVLFSCKQNTTFDEPEQTVTEKSENQNEEFVTVKLAVDKSFRQAFTPNTDNYKDYSFILSGYLNDSKELTRIMDWGNLDSIEGSEFQIRKGNWKLVLTASEEFQDPETKEWNIYPVLRGTLTKEITKAETLNFKMEQIPDSGIDGHYEIYIHYPTSKYWNVSVTIKDLKTLETVEGEEYNASIERDDSLACIYGNLPSGEYKIGAKLVYKSPTLETTSSVPIFVVIASDCITFGELFMEFEQLNMSRPINYYGYDPKGGEYSFKDDDFPTVFTSYESYDLPVPIHTGDYEFLGWYTDSNLAKGTEITKTPMTSDYDQFELTLYPKWRATYSPYFSLTDEEGINFILSEEVLAGFDDGTITSAQYFIKNEETNYELNVWFSTDEMKEIDFAYNYPFVDNGTSYEVWIIFGGIVTEKLGITPKTGLGEDKHIYENAGIEVDEQGVLRITDIPEYTKYGEKEFYSVTIWEGEGWDHTPAPIWRENYVWEEFEENYTSLDLVPYFEKDHLYGKYFMATVNRDYWYKGKKYVICLGNPTLVYGDINHKYADDPDPVQDVIEWECSASYDNFIPFREAIKAGSGYTTVSVEWRAVSKDAMQVGFQLQNESDNGKLGSSFAYVFSEDFGDYTISKANCFVGATYTDYVLSEEPCEMDCSDGATRIEIFFQDKNYVPVAGKVYIRRIWLSGPGLESKLILLNPDSNSGNSSVEEDRPFVLKCNNDYNNFIDLKVPIKEGSGYTTINAEIKWEADNGVRAGFELRDADYAQASSTVKFGTDYSVVSGKCLYGSYYDDWSTGEATPVACSDSAVMLQMFIEERTEDGYEATQGKIYIKRIWLSGEGKDDYYIIGKDKNNNSGETQEGKTYRKSNFSVVGSDLSSSEWAFAYYDLNEYSGKYITIDFSCDMQVKNSGTDSTWMRWQLTNDGDYPMIVDYTFEPEETDFVHMTGTLQPTLVRNSMGAIYLSTYELELENLEVSVKNIEYKVTCVDPGSIPDTDDTNAYKIDCYDYDNHIYLDYPVSSGSGYTSFKVEWRWESEYGEKAWLQLMNGESEQASSSTSGSHGYTVTEAFCLAGAEYDDWISGSLVIKECADEIDNIQVYIQDDTYNPVSGTIYIRKVWLCAEDKADYIIFDAEKYEGLNSNSSSIISQTYYSYEVVSDGITFTFNENGNCTNADFDDSMKKIAEGSLFSEFVIYGDFWTKFVLRGTEMWDKDSAKYCTVINQDSSLVLDMSGAALLTCVPKDGIYTAEMSGITYRFKRNDFVFVEEGTFERSSDKVLVRSFNICDHLVTQNEYMAVMGENPSTFNSNPTEGEKQENRPVENISWFDAIVYCNKRSVAEGLKPCYSLNGSFDTDTWGYAQHNHESIDGEIVWTFEFNGYRLPTEAEWEFAARGGIKGNGYMFSGSEKIDDVAWYVDNSGNVTHEIMKKAPNELGLYDMSGNVWEWCWDWWTENYDSDDLINPIGASSGTERVFRGGAYYEMWGCTVSCRGSGEPCNPYDSVGFRVVRSCSN